MKRTILIALLMGLLFAVSLVAPAAAQGMSVTCDTGATFDNGVQVTVVQMRAGYTYNATAIGLNGFDPVLAVLDESGTGLCNDDDATAARYTASLPSTGTVPASNLSSRVTFNHNDPSGFRDVSLVVGGYGNTAGEFLLILEGMAVTSEDVYGDPFRIGITPGMVAYGMPMTSYMIAKTNGFDPLMYEIDANGNVRTDTSGNDVFCDDAGTNLCWGQSRDLSGSYVTTVDGRLGGYGYDAMIQLPLEDDAAVNLLMSSYEGNTLGQYIVAFHMGTAAGGTVGQAPQVGGNAPQSGGNVPQVGGNAPQSGGSAPQSVGTTSGISVTCDTGATFDNGVQVTVVQMRAGYTYNATAIGLNGFDPVLAVLDESGTGLCNDDDATAARYTASLPSSGSVPASNLSSRVTFNHNDPSGFRDVSLVVGGYGNTAGEFVLILEGMAVTTEDVYGDPFRVSITPGMLASGMPFSAYMISNTNGFDPLMYEVDASGNVRTDTSGSDVYCDDAGTNTCWGQSRSLVGSFVSTVNGRLGGNDWAPMLQLPLEQVGDVTLLMSSYQGNTTGQYIVAFHMAIGTGFQPSA